MPVPDDLTPPPPAPSPAATAALAAMTAALADWRTAHPHATFAELEAAVETQLAQVRAQVLADALPADAAPGTEAARPGCTQCGAALVSRGRHPRTLRVIGDAPVTLLRTYWTGPRCGEGVFPPG